MADLMERVDSTAEPVHAALTLQIDHDHHDHDDDDDDHDDGDGDGDGDDGGDDDDGVLNEATMHTYSRTYNNNFVKIKYFPVSKKLCYFFVLSYCNHLIVFCFGHKFN